MSSDEQEHEEQEEERVEEPKMATAKGRGKRLTDSERMEIIARLEDKSAPLSRAKCARLYGVTPAAISKLMKVSQTVKKRYSDAGVEAGHMRDKRQRGGFSKNMCFEDELFKWICSIRARRIPLLVAHVQQKAKLLAAKHQMNEDFKASNGWYYRFCARYGLAPGSLHAGGCSNAPINVRTRVVDSQRSSVDAHAHRINTGGVSDSEDNKERNSSSNNNNNNSADEKIKSATVTAAAVWSDDPVTSEKVGNLQDQVKKFGPEFVYSLSEARLFYKLLPNQLLPANQQNGGDSENGGSENDANAATKGNTERVMVLVCANGTGTHKIPLLVVGKHARPSCFAVNQHGDGNTNQFSYYNQTSAAGHVTMQVGTSKYFSQREVWCDNQTFQYWCTSVFAPAIRARTTQPVLLLMDNPGGSLEEFQFANIATYFLPTRAGSLSAALQSGAASSTHAQFQPLQHGVIRELKRRYKIAIFQEVLSFLEKGDEERYRLLQRAMNRPLGAAGIAFGRLPHVADAMALLEDVWSAIPADLLRTGWVRSNLYSEGLHEYDSADNDQQQQRPDISDDTVVLELCSMLRHIKSVDELHGLPKEIRLWMYADDDASERMQQELLHDVQRLLQEEEDESKARGDVVSNAAASLPSQVNVGFVGSNSASYEHNGSFTSSLMHSTAVHQHQQQHQQPVYGDLSSMNSNNSSSNSMGYGYSLQQHLHNPQSHYNTRSLQPPQQLHHLQQHQQQQHGSPMTLREQRKSISFALRALSNAEEALDNADVAEYFGDEATSDAIKSIGAVLRRLRRIQRGKQSTLSAPRPAAANVQAIGHTAAGSREPLNAHAAAASAHTYFYGDAK